MNRSYNYIINFIKKKIIHILKTSVRFNNFKHYSEYID